VVLKIPTQGNMEIIVIETGLGLGKREEMNFPEEE